MARRSSSGSTVANRRLDVAIYGSDGTTILPDPTGARFDLAGLRFSTGLPGGFLECSFTVSGSAAALYALRAGLRVIVRRGRRIVWWGWIEDLDRLVYGRVLSVDLTCLGPWQEPQQRKSETMVYTDVISSSALAEELAEHCPNISRDTSQIANSGKAITINWSWKAISDLVKLACDTGNSDGLPLQFAIWEPTYERTRLGNTANRTSDPELELTDAFWYLVDGTYANWDTVNSHSPQTCMLFAEFANDALAHSAKLSVSPSTAYTVEFWHKWSAHSSMTVNSRVDWYTAGDVFISSTYGATYTSNGSNTAWTQRLDTHTSPLTAATGRPMVAAVVGSGATRYTAVDDVKFYLAATALTIDRLPRAWLWPRDLSGYDYLLYTRLLSNPLSETETTRNVVNYVVASYSSSSYTTAGQDAESQALYRRRDYLVAAGSVGLADADAQRDVYLAAYSSPRKEPAGFAVPEGAVRTTAGAIVEPVLLRAGDRLRLADGPSRGATIALLSTEFRDGVMTCKPEAQEDTSMLLARR
jgi:hypothetical protein